MPSPNDDNNVENDDKNTILVLCCTCNIGNQEPDLKSMHEWIPVDGITSKVLNKQQYPVQTTSSDSTTAIMKKKLKCDLEKFIEQQRKNDGARGGFGSNDDLNDEKKEEDDRDFSDENGDALDRLTPEKAKELNLPRFDIIAIGLQEATFEVTAPTAKRQKDADHKYEGDGSGDDVEEKLLCEKSFHRKKGPVLRKLKEVQSVVTDADYNSNIKNSNDNDLMKRSSHNAANSNSNMVDRTVRRFRSMVSSLSVSGRSEHEQTTRSLSPSSAQRLKHKSSSVLTTSSDSSNLPFRNEVSKLEVVDDDNDDDIDVDLSVDYDTKYIHTMLRKHLPSYKRLVSYQRGQMRLLVFYYKRNKRNSSTSATDCSTKIDTIDVLCVKAQNTGLAGLANKGGIVAECDINNGTRISFLSAHLEAHEGISKYNTRCTTIGDILRGTQSNAVSDYACDISLSSHYTFVMGDLNFRTRLPVFEPGSDEHIASIHQLTRHQYWDMLNECDELSMALKRKDCLVGFSTPRCNFPPTFKVLRERGYRYNERRSPSYTDRILHKANHLMSRNVGVLAYGPVDNFTSSDHKPMRGAYSVQLNKPLKWRPVLVHNNKSVRWNTGRPGRILRGLTSMDSTSGLVRSQNLHLVCSSIQCKIASEGNPSPFISFVSTPSAAMKIVMVKKDWKHYVTFWKSKRDTLMNVSGGTRREHGWPRTPTAANQKTVQWNEEVYFKIRTHDDTGRPLNLTGALLHVLIHDAKNDSNVIGSCTLNLAFIIEVSKSEMGKKEKKEPGATHHSSKNIAQAFAARLMKRRDLPSAARNSSCSASALSRPRSSESLNIFREYSRAALTAIKHDQRFSESVSGSCAACSQKIDAGVISETEMGQVDSNDTLGSEEELTPHQFLQSQPSDAVCSLFHSTNLASSGAKLEDIHCLHIDEAITKNGKEVGRVKFTIDTWWLNEQMMHDEGMNDRQRLADLSEHSKIYNRDPK